MQEDAQAVRRILAEDLAFSTDPVFRKALESALCDRPFSAGRAMPWFMLPILTCEVLGGTLRHAHHVAAGLEIGRIAAGCLDEWQDHDTDDALWRSIGPERTVSLATGMIALSLLALTRLADEGVPAAVILRLQDEFHLTLLRMSEGQYADLGGELTLDDYQTVAGAKSGALFRLGCRAGAILAGVPEEIVGRYGNFGHHFGILAQVWNDFCGLAGFQGKRDMEHGRALPILAASALGQDEYRPSSEEGQAGRLYALVQLNLLYQRAAEALARCPAPGRLALFLDQYAPNHLLENTG